MKLRIVYTITIDDEFRRAFNHRLGKPGLATRKEVAQHYRMNGLSMDNDIIDEYRASDEFLHSHDEEDSP